MTPAKEAVIMAKWLKGVCLSVAQSRPDNEHDQFLKMHCNKMALVHKRLVLWQELPLLWIQISEVESGCVCQSGGYEGCNFQQQKWWAGDVPSKHPNPAECELSVAQCPQLSGPWMGGQYLLWWCFFFLPRPCSRSNPVWKTPVEDKTETSQVSWYDLGLMCIWVIICEHRDVLFVQHNFGVYWRQARTPDIWLCSTSLSFASINLHGRRHGWQSEKIRLTFPSHKFGISGASAVFSVRLCALAAPADWVMFVTVSMNLPLWRSVLASWNVFHLNTGAII